MKQTLQKASGMQSHSIPDPIVDLLSENGDVLAIQYRWWSNPTSYVWELKKPIDFELIEATFQLPSSITLMKEFDQADYGIGTPNSYGPAC